jgi:hypothetical protein
MQAPSWDLRDRFARCALDRWSATIDLLKPECGLTNVETGSHRLSGGQWLGLGWPAAQGDPKGELVECYHRGSDLVVAYRQSPAWPVRVDAMWRAAPRAEAAAVLAVVDLIVSVRTELLESWPELTVRSSIPSREILRLVSADSAQFAPVPNIAAVPFVVNSDTGPCCLLFRLPDAGLSYGEMVHPADFQRSNLKRLAGHTATIEVRHRLFAERLEKGVILRARVRGVWVDGVDDIRQVAGCYSAFAAAEPPLGA